MISYGYLIIICIIMENIVINSDDDVISLLSNVRNKKVNI